MEEASLSMSIVTMETSMQAQLIMYVASFLAPIKLQKPCEFYFFFKGEGITVSLIFIECYYHHIVLVLLAVPIFNHECQQQMVVLCVIY